MEDLDLFRWILLAIGIIVFLAVYLFGKISKKSRNEGIDEHDSDRLLYAEPANKDSEESQLSTDDAPVESSEVSEKVITLYLISETGSHFSGSDIMRAAKSTDLVLGENNIFHKYADFDGQNVTVFSVANITEPGTFNADEMYRFTTRGLVFFLIVPLEINGMQAFEMLLDTAEHFKKILNGILVSKDKVPYTLEKIQQIREEVQEFLD